MGYDKDKIETCSMGCKPVRGIVPQEDRLSPSELWCDATATRSAADFVFNKEEQEPPKKKRALLRIKKVTRK